MKKSFFASLLFALTTLAPGMANTNPGSYALLGNSKVLVKTKLIKEKTFQLQLANLDKKYTYVSLTNLNEDRIYFSEGFRSKNDYLRNINISNLVDGKYLLKVKSNGEALTQIIKVVGSNVYFSDFK
ncbi:MAG: hypothetical protein ACI8P3_003828 [Saprospiraceae bacterium]|jgi:hypothetical protein